VHFKKATREQAKGRVAIIGPSGAGKTYTMLLLLQKLGKRIAVIDSERGSASKYAGCTDKTTGVTFDFDVLELESHSPEAYVQAIQLAEREGYDAIGVDSLSHAWMGKDGALEQVDKAAKRSQSGNSFTAWRDVTPKHNALVDALTMCRAHLIVTMRSKTEYVLEEDARGKKTPRKIGLAPIQRDGLEYEFDVVGDMNHEHDYVISKTRCAVLDGAVIHKPGAQLAETLRAWLETGAAPTAKQPAAPTPRPASVPPPRDDSEDPAVFVLQHTKNKGKRLGDLTDAQISWYADDCKDPVVSRAASAVREARYRKRELDALAAADAAEKDINKDWGLGTGDEDENPEHAGSIATGSFSHD
jgi:hypothetical protein